MRARWVFVLSVVGSLIPLPRTTVEEWTVRVVDEQGAAMAGVTVEQFAADGNFDVMGDYWSDVTNHLGIVVFPARVRWRPIVWFAATRIWVLLQLHEGFGGGVEGDVSITDHKKVEWIEPGVRIEARCRGAQCTRQPLSSELRVRRPK